MRISKLLLTGTLFSAVAILEGCATGADRVGVYDPNERLDEVLVDYKANAGGDVNCHYMQQAPVDCEKMVQDLEALSLEFPNHARTLLANAILQYQLGNMINSQYQLDQLLALPIKMPEAALLRSRIAMSEGNFALARTVISRQLQLVPDYPDLYEAQAASYYLEGRYDKALVAIHAADRLGAPAWRISYHLGLIYEALDQIPQACAQYNSVLRTQPSHRQSISHLLLLSDHDECRAPA